MPTKTDTNKRTMKVKWKAPSTSRRGPRKEATYRFAFVETLKKHPGKWAVYKENITYASDITAGKRDYPEVEWTSRKTGNGKFTIYARYIGK